MKQIILCWFLGPYDRTCDALIVLQNPTDFTVGWRCRTLEPKRYVVKPSKGVLKPKASLTLLIKLKRIKNMDEFDVKKQKFLLQSVVAESADDSLPDMVCTWKYQILS